MLFRSLPLPPSLPLSPFLPSSHSLSLPPFLSLSRCNACVSARCSRILSVVARSLSDKLDDSDADDEPEENEDGNYTVYECPGLAPVSTLAHEKRQPANYLLCMHHPHYLPPPLDWRNGGTESAIPGRQQQQGQQSRQPHLVQQV